MNPSYARIRVPKAEALRRYATWNQLGEVGRLVSTDPVSAVRQACDDRGHWRGNALFIHERAGWTVLNDLSGCLSCIPAESWLEFAGPNELVFAGYNDAIGYGELIAINGGQVLREFLYLAGSPGENVNRGRLESDCEPLESWVEVAGFIDRDDLAFSERGWLWVYRGHAGGGATRS